MTAGLCLVYREARATRGVPTLIKRPRALCSKAGRRRRPYLFPSGAEFFKRSRKKPNEAISGFADCIRATAERASRPAAKPFLVREKRLENSDTLDASASSAKRTKSYTK
jgi:hypothetical protein